MASKSPIVIEGPDGAGKTTLANSLCDKYTLEYRRPDPEMLSSSFGPLTDALVQWWDHELALPPSKLASAVYDRCFYISDPIYQMAQIERELITASHHLAHGIMKLWNVEPILIFCLPPFEVQLANVRADERPRLKGVSDRALEKVSNAYWAYYSMWANALHDNVLEYDYTEDRAWEHVTHFLEDVGVA